MMREQRTTTRRRKKLRRFSRIAEQSADNISDVLSCLRFATLAAENTACITKMRHSLEAPLRVDRGVLATPAKRMPATQPRAVPRVGDASRPLLLKAARASRSA
jgi:hypothetical protein